MFGILNLLAKIFVMIYCGYKFATGDKDEISTLWYGMWVMIALI